MRDKEGEGKVLRDGMDGCVGRVGGVMMRSEHLKCVNVAERARQRKEGIRAIARVKRELQGTVSAAS